MSEFLLTFLEALFISCEAECLHYKNPGNPAIVSHSNKWLNVRINVRVSAKAISCSQTIEQDTRVQLSDVLI